MKNAKKILFMMMLSAPLFGMEPDSSKINDKSSLFKKDKEAFVLRKNVIGSTAKTVYLGQDDLKFLDDNCFAQLRDKAVSEAVAASSASSAASLASAVAANEQAGHEKRFRNSAFVSVLSLVTLGGTFAAAKYAPEATAKVLSNPNVALAQAGLAGVALTSAASAVNEARQGGCKNFSLANYAPNLASYVPSFMKKAGVAKPADKKEEPAPVKQD